MTPEGAARPFPIEHPAFALSRPVLLESLRDGNTDRARINAQVTLSAARAAGIEGDFTIDDVLAAARDRLVSDAAPSLPVEHFLGYMPSHGYLYTPTGDMWPASSVNARVAPVVDRDGKKLKPADWIDRNAAVEQMTWAPGDDMLIRGRLLVGGGWIEQAGVTCFNLYRPPVLPPGNPDNVSLWLEQIDAMYGRECIDHLVDYFAHAVQRPGEKPNHGIVLGGAPGIGKDTILEPVRHAVGAHNVAEVSPVQMMGRFNGFVKSVLLVVQEARDMGEVDRYSFYDHTKVYLAAPPAALRCDEKNLREYPVLNVCRVVITTNHKSDGLFLPADDRRHFVAWSDRTRDDFGAEHWRRLWRWYADGGIANVAAYLRRRDLSGFDPKAPPPRTAAWHDVVNANRAPEDAELADVLDAIGRDVAAVTLGELQSKAETLGMETFAEYLRDRRNRRAIPHRLEAAGFTPVQNPTAPKDGYYVIAGRRQAIYARAALSPRERLAAADRIARAG